MLRFTTKEDKKVCLFSLIEETQETFKKNMESAFSLKPICSPIFLLEKSGFNDELNYVEKPIRFATSSGDDCVIIHSLSKWKRYTLGRINKSNPEITGIITRMDAIRKDEEKKDVLKTRVHSYYVDQWDWEMIIKEEERNVDFLKQTVERIYEQLLKTKAYLDEKYPNMFVKNKLAPKITFITSQELEDKYPSLTPKERENEAAKKFGAIFIIGIGHYLKTGKKHDGRAPDYDDWNLNGDLIVFNSVIGTAVELSSMGIRVNKESMLKQLEIMEKNEKKELLFHKSLLEGKLPQTIGGGIGRSRVTMFLLEAKHIGEVQCSVWPKELLEDSEFDIL